MGQTGKPYHSWSIAHCIEYSESFCFISGERHCSDPTLKARLFNREEKSLIPCWICFFYFNPCFSLLLFTERILSVHNDLPQGTLPLSLNAKLKCPCSVKHPDPVHLCGYRKEEINTQHSPLPHQGWPFQEIFARLMSFLLYFLNSTCLSSKKKLASRHQWDGCLGTLVCHLLGSLAFLNEVVFLASTPHLQFFDSLCGKQSDIWLNKNSKGLNCFQVS